MLDQGGKGIGYNLNSPTISVAFTAKLVKAPGWNFYFNTKQLYLRRRIYSEQSGTDIL